MRLLRGIIHVHSNYSYDGEHSLAEIAQYAVTRGYSFIGMSEHSDTFDRKRMAEYVEECERLSTPQYVLIPGIEFRCEAELHVVGLGITHYTDAKDPVEVARFIHEKDGIAILAHPVRYDYQIPSGVLCAVDGVEAWNALYDGRFVPNDSSLTLISEARKKQTCSILAFGAQDLHRIRSRCDVELTVSCNELSKASVLRALKAGHFTISNPYFRLDSTNDVGPFQLAQIRAARLTYNLARRLRDTLW